ncbi:MAG: histidinol-phosphatase [Clostridia bacterium]|nr:histidinol-phosphatase [Clostridia bacterium]
MIDWHSHILPNMDDGSRNVSESTTLLRMLADQGVDTVVATPHFYATAEAAEDFLQRRARCYESLTSAISSDFESPRILLGAEVKYYPGISAREDLRDFCIEGTRLLLLEMPFSEWTEYTVRELNVLACSKGVTIVLAHIERYLPFQRSDLWNRLRNNGILMQMNASYFSGLGTRRKALRLLEDGFVHMIGTDCHNTTSRPPLMSRACVVIRKRFGENFISQMHEYGHSLLVYK